jgi:hypothetical protein
MNALPGITPAEFWLWLSLLLLIITVFSGGIPPEE